MQLRFKDDVVRFCVVIEHLDGSVSANGPYDLEPEARLACYAMAEYEAQELDTTVAHRLDGSTVGDPDSGMDTIDLYVQRLGQPVDTSE